MSTQITPPKQSTNITWRIDGSESSGLRVFATPHFAISRPPLRIDIWIVAQMIPPLLREEDGMTQTGLGMVPVPVESLKSTWLPRVRLMLSSWSAFLPNFTERYLALPFGSRIVIRTVRPDLDNSEIEFLPRPEVEQSLKTVAQIQATWSLPVKALSSTICWEDLAIEEQRCTSISLVRVVSRPDLGTVVFKSLVEDTRSMFHELRHLLGIPEHRNINPQPIFIVTMISRVTGGRVICGFVRPHYALGDMEKAIISAQYTTTERLLWSIAISKALLHMHKSAAVFHPDLRPDNILLSQEGDCVEPLLIDLEQRGVWYRWAPPEVSYLMYLELVATKADDITKRQKYADMLRHAFPFWQQLGEQSPEIFDSKDGFNFAWIALSQDDREKAQVFLLGKTLWCIFERSNAVYTSGTGGTAQNAHPRPTPTFPEFHETPTALRDCIRKCTAGAPEWEGRTFPLDARRGRVFPPPAIGSPWAEEVLLQEGMDAVRRDFSHEIDAAEYFVQSIANDPRAVLRHTFPFVRIRPSLSEVIHMLETAMNEMVN